jgi:hypothetical protein
LGVGEKHEEACTYRDHCLSQRPRWHCPQNNKALNFHDGEQPSSRKLGGFPQFFARAAYATQKAPRKIEKNLTLTFIYHTTFSPQKIFSKTFTDRNIGAPSRRLTTLK